MALFSSVFIRLFERFAHFLYRRETQPCAAQELAECVAFEFTANDRKCRKRCRKVPKKCQLGEIEEEREVKIEGKIGHKDEAEEERMPLSLEKIKKKRKLKQRKATEPTPVLVKVKPLVVVPPCPDEVVSPQNSSSQVCPSKPPMLPLAVPPCPTPAPDELFSSSQGRHPKRLPPSPTPAPDKIVALQRPPSRKPDPFTSSLCEPLPELMLIDIEDEENEYVTFPASDFHKSERPQTPEAEMKPRKMVAWLEKDSKVQEEVWECEVVGVQGFEEEDPNEMGDSSTIQGHASLKTELDELSVKLFCLTSPDDPKNDTQHTVNIKEKCKRKFPLFLLTWAEEKAKNKEVKKVIKEKKRQEKELLLERYMNDPKLKHLWINKHNRNYCFS